MRVIGGLYGGRQLVSPTGNRTHPMSDKIRGALFNALGDIKGLRLLDGFAGSGAIGFEALSRGARGVVALDPDRQAIRSIEQNRISLGIGLDQLKASQAGCTGWSRRNRNELFDIVVIDPPFDGRNSLFVEAFRLAKHLAPQGILVASLPPDIANRTDHYFTGTLDIVSSKNYGDACLVFFRQPTD